MPSIKLSKIQFPENWNLTEKAAAETALTAIEQKVNLYLKNHASTNFNHRTLDISFDLHRGVTLDDGNHALTLSFDKLKLKPREYAPIFPHSFPSLERRSSHSSVPSDDEEHDDLSTEEEAVNTEIQTLQQRLQYVSNQCSDLYQQKTSLAEDKELLTITNKIAALRLELASPFYRLKALFPSYHRSSETTYTELYKLVYSYYEKRLPVLSALTTKTADDLLLLDFLQQLKSMTPGTQIVPFFDIYLKLYEAQQNKQLAPLSAKIQSSIDCLKKSLPAYDLTDPASILKEEREQLLEDHEVEYSLSLPIPTALCYFRRNKQDYNFDLYQFAGTTPRLRKALLQRYKELLSRAQKHLQEAQSIQAQGAQANTLIHQQLQGVDKLLNISTKSHPLPGDIPNAATLFPLLQQIPAHYPITHPQEFTELANTLDLEILCNKTGCPMAQALIKKAQETSEAWLQTQQGQLYAFLNTKPAPQPLVPLTRPSTVATNPSTLRQAAPLPSLQRGIYPAPREAELTTEEYQRQLLLQRLSAPTTAPLQTLAQRNVAFNNSAS